MFNHSGLRVYHSTSSTNFKLITFSERVARSLKEAMSKQHDDLRSKISETEVEKWTQLIDAEREHMLFDQDRIGLIV